MVAQDIDLKVDVVSKEIFTPPSSPLRHLHTLFQTTASFSTTTVTVTACDIPSLSQVLTDLWIVVQTDIAAEVENGVTDSTAPTVNVDQFIAELYDYAVHAKTPASTSALAIATLLLPLHLRKTPFTSSDARTKTAHLYPTLFTFLGDQALSTTSDSLLNAVVSVPLVLEYAISPNTLTFLFEFIASVSAMFSTDTSTTHSFLVSSPALVHSLLRLSHATLTLVSYPTLAADTPLPLHVAARALRLFAALSVITPASHTLVTSVTVESPTSTALVTVLRAWVLPVLSNFPFADKPLLSLIPATLAPTLPPHVQVSLFLRATIAFAVTATTPVLPSCYLHIVREDTSAATDIHCALKHTAAAAADAEAKAETQAKAKMNVTSPASAAVSIEEGKGDEHDDEASTASNTIAPTTANESSDSDHESLEALLSLLRRMITGTLAHMRAVHDVTADDLFSPVAAPVPRGPAVLSSSERAEQAQLRGQSPAASPASASDASADVELTAVVARAQPLDAGEDCAAAPLSPLSPVAPLFAPLPEHDDEAVAVRGAFLPVSTPANANSNASGPRVHFTSDDCPSTVAVHAPLTSSAQLLLSAALFAALLDAIVAVTHTLATVASPAVAGARTSEAATMLTSLLEDVFVVAPPPLPVTFPLQASHILSVHAVDARAGYPSALVPLYRIFSDAYTRVYDNTNIDLAAFEHSTLTDNANEWIIPGVGSREVSSAAVTSDRYLASLLLAALARLGMQPALGPHPTAADADTPADADLDVDVATPASVAVPTREYRSPVAALAAFSARWLRSHDKVANERGAFLRSVREVRASGSGPATSATGAADAMSAEQFSSAQAQPDAASAVFAASSPLSYEGQMALFHDRQQHWLFLAVSAAALSGTAAAATRVLSVAVEAVASVLALHTRPLATTEQTQLLARGSVSGPVEAGTGLPLQYSDPSYAHVVAQDKLLLALLPALTTMAALPHSSAVAQAAKRPADVDSTEAASSDASVSPFTLSLPFFSQLSSLALALVDVCYRRLFAASLQIVHNVHLSEKRAEESGSDSDSDSDSDDNVTVGVDALECSRLSTANASQTRVAAYGQGGHTLASAALPSLSSLVVLHVLLAAATTACDTMARAAGAVTQTDVLALITGERAAQAAFLGDGDLASVLAATPTHASLSCAFYIPPTDVSAPLPTATTVPPHHLCPLPLAPLAVPSLMAFARRAIALYLDNAARFTQCAPLLYALTVQPTASRKSAKKPAHAEKHSVHNPAKFLLSSPAASQAMRPAASAAPPLLPFFPLSYRMCIDLYWLQPMLSLALVPLATALSRLAHPHTRAAVTKLIAPPTLSPLSPAADASLVGPSLWVPLHPDPLASASLYRRLWHALTITQLCVRDYPCMAAADVVVPQSLHALVRQLTVPHSPALASKGGLLKTLLARVRRQPTRPDLTSPLASPAAPPAAVAGVPLTSLLGLYAPFVGVALSGLAAHRTLATHTPALSFDHHTATGKCVSPPSELVHAALSLRLLQRTPAGKAKDAKDDELTVDRGRNVPIARHKAVLLEQLRTRLAPGRFRHDIAHDKEHTRDLLVALTAQNALRPGATLGLPFGVDPVRNAAADIHADTQVQVARPSRYSSVVGSADRFTYRRGKVDASTGYPKRKGSTKAERQYYRDLCVDAGKLSHAEALFCIATVLVEAYRQRAVALAAATLEVNDIALSAPTSTLVGPSVAALHYAHDTVIRGPVSASALAPLPFALPAPAADSADAEADVNATGLVCSDLDTLRSTAPSFPSSLTTNLYTVLYAHTASSPTEPSTPTVLATAGADQPLPSAAQRLSEVARTNAAIRAFVDATVYAAPVPPPTLAKPHHGPLSRVLDAVLDAAALTAFAQLAALPASTHRADALACVHTQCTLALASRYDRVRFKAWQLVEALTRFAPTVQLASPGLLTALSATHALATSLRSGAVLDEPATAHVPALVIVPVAPHTALSLREHSTSVLRAPATALELARAQTNGMGSGCEEGVLVALSALSIPEFQVTRQLAHTLFRRLVTRAVGYTHAHGNEHDAVKLTMLLGAAPQQRNAAIKTVLGGGVPVAQTHVPAQLAGLTLGLAENAFLCATGEDAALLMEAPADAIAHGYRSLLTDTHAHAPVNDVNSAPPALSRLVSTDSTLAPFLDVPTHSPVTPVAPTSTTTTSLVATEHSLSVLGSFTGGPSLAEDSLPLPLTAPAAAASTSSTFTWSLTLRMPPIASAAAQSLRTIVPTLACRAILQPRLGKSSAAAQLAARSSSSPPNSLSSSSSYYYYTHLSPYAEEDAGQDDAEDDFTAWALCYPYADNTCLMPFTHAALADPALSAPQLTQHLDLISRVAHENPEASDAGRSLPCVTSRLFSPRVSALTGFVSRSDAELNAARTQALWKHPHGPAVRTRDLAPGDAGILALSSSRLLTASAASEAAHHVAQRYRECMLRVSARDGLVLATAASSPRPLQLEHAPSTADSLLSVSTFSPSAFAWSELVTATSAARALCEEYARTHHTLSQACTALAAQHVKDPGMMYSFHKRPLHTYAQPEVSADTLQGSEAALRELDTTFIGAGTHDPALFTLPATELATRVAAALAQQSSLLARAHSLATRIAALVLFDAHHHGLHSHAIAAVLRRLDAHARNAELDADACGAGERDPVRGWIRSAIATELTHIMATPTTANTSNDTATRLVLALDTLALLLTGMFCTSAVRAVTTAWSWLLASLADSPAFLLAFDRAATAAWTHTVKHRIGLFSAPDHDIPHDAASTAPAMQTASWSRAQLWREVGFIADSISASSVEQALTHLLPTIAPALPLPTSPLSLCLSTRAPNAHALLLSFFAAHADTHLACPADTRADGYSPGNVLANIALVSLARPTCIRADSISIPARVALLSLALAQAAALSASLHRSLLATRAGLLRPRLAHARAAFTLSHRLRSQAVLALTLTFRIFPLTHTPSSPYYPLLRSIARDQLPLPAALLTPVHTGYSCGVAPSSPAIQHHVLSVAHTVRCPGSPALPRADTAATVAALVALCDRLQLVEPAVDKLHAELGRLLGIPARPMAHARSLSVMGMVLPLPAPASGSAAHWLDATVAAHALTQLRAHAAHTQSRLMGTEPWPAATESSHVLPASPVATAAGGEGTYSPSAGDIPVLLRAPTFLAPALALPLADAASAAALRECAMVLTAAHLDQLALLHDPLHALLVPPKRSAAYEPSSSVTVAASATAMVAQPLPPHPYSLRLQCGGAVSNSGPDATVAPVPLISTDTVSDEASTTATTPTVPAFPCSDLDTRALASRTLSVGCWPCGAPLPGADAAFPLAGVSTDNNARRLKSSMPAASEAAWVSRLMLAWSIHPSLALAIAESLPQASALHSASALLARTHPHLLCPYPEALPHLIDLYAPAAVQAAAFARSPTGLYVVPAVAKVTSTELYGAPEARSHALDAPPAFTRAETADDMLVSFIPACVPHPLRPLFYLYLYLPAFTPAPLADALTLLAPPFASHKPLVAHAARSLRALSGAAVWPCLPQLIQLLRFDNFAVLAQTMAHAAAADGVLAHCVAQACQAELAACGAMTEGDADAVDHSDHAEAPAAASVPGRVVDGEWQWDDGYEYEEEELSLDQVPIKPLSPLPSPTAATSVPTESNDAAESVEGVAGSTGPTAPASPRSIAGERSDPLATTTTSGKYRVVALPDGRVTVPLTVVARAVSHVRAQCKQYRHGPHPHYVLLMQDNTATGPAAAVSTASSASTAAAALSSDKDPHAHLPASRLAAADNIATVSSDTGYFRSLQCVCAWSLRALDARGMRQYLDQTAFFEQIVGVSGHLVALPKGPERVRALHAALRTVRVRPDVYPPTDPAQVVRGLRPESGRTLQSAAKVPILVGFDVAPREELHAGNTTTSRLALIFKSHDDIRQDALALQILSLCQAAYTACGTDLTVVPYRVLPTSLGGVPGGVIECVPDAASRDEIGKKMPGSLKSYFLHCFGKPNGRAFLSAQRQFLLTLAGYAVSSYLLQVKDRHNGNIMVNGHGQLIHIDFGFIFDISPGGDMRFENAAFKLTREMGALLGGSDIKQSPLYAWFTQSVLRGFLAVRARHRALSAVTVPMLTSTLKCFKGTYAGAHSPSVERLRDRLCVGQDEYAAVKAMFALVRHANSNWRTNTYDWIQLKQQNIYYWRGKEEDDDNTAGQLYEY